MIKRTNNYDFNNFQSSTIPAQLLILPMETPILYVLEWLNYLMWSDAFGLIYQAITVMAHVQGQEQCRWVSDHAYDYHSLAIGNS